MRAVSRGLLVLLAGVAACLDKQAAPVGEGIVSVIMPAGKIDSGHVIVTGPTNQTVSAAPGGSVTISNLAPGSYTVSLEGFSGNAVAYYGQITGVTVTAGQTTAATAGAFNSIQPTIIAMPTYTTTGQFQLVFSKVASAASYVVQRDTLATFATSKDTTLTAVTDTNVTVGAPTTKTYQIRVLAIDPSGGRGLASIARAIQTVVGVTIAPATFSMAPGATKQFTATAKDGSGNTVTGLTVAWSSNNQAVATVDTTGTATGIAGGTAIITGAALGVPGNAVLTVTGGTATQVVFTTQPSNATAGGAISPAVELEVRDVNGNRVTTARNQVTLAIASGPGGTLFGTTTINANNGVASFSGINIHKAGAGYTLSAASSGLTGATSSSFNISPAAADHLAFSTPPSNTEGNVVMAPNPAVQILDTYGNLTSSTAAVTIALSKNPWQTPFAKGGTLKGTTTQSAVAGVATFNDLKIDRPASGYQFTATSGTLTSATSPSFNVNLTISSIAPGDFFTCAIAAGGTYCWGYGGDGELGDSGAVGSIYIDSVPGLVSGGLTFTQISAGGSHVCGITTGANNLYCWGGNYNGQLGDNTTTSRSYPATVNGGRTFTQVDAGESQACGVTSAGRVFCWGYNGNGQIGDGTKTQRVVPTEEFLGLTTWGSVSTGYAHTCALVASGANNVYCWGYNGYSQLGYSGADTTKPALVATGGDQYGAISAGGDHTCGFVSGSSSIKCWGANYSGQVGNNASLPGANVTAPAAVSGGITWASNMVATSAYTYYQYESSCGINTSKAALCWGYDSYGELGDGNVSGTSEAAPVLVSGGLLFDSVRGGGLHMCGLVGSTAYCWGYNGNGNLGIGSTGGNKTVPTKIIQ